MIYFFIYTTLAYMICGFTLSMVSKDEKRHIDDTDMIMFTLSPIVLPGLIFLTLLATFLTVFVGKEPE